MTMSVPGPNAGSTPPAAFVRTTIPRAEPAHEQDRLDDEPRVVALVHVEPALEHDDRHAVEPAEEQPADVTRRRRGRPAGQVRERDRDRVLEVVGEAAEPRAEDDPDPRHEVDPGPDGRLERVEPGGLVGGRDRARRDRRQARRAGWRHGRAGLRRARPGGRRPRPASETPDGVPTPGCRSRPSGGRRPGADGEAAGSGQRSARSDRRGAEILDVISVSPVPDGPFGQDLRYGPAVAEGQRSYPRTARIGARRVSTSSAPCGRRVDKPVARRSRAPSAAHREHLDPRQARRRRLGPQLGVAVVADPPDRGDRRRAGLVVATSPARIAQDRAQVVALRARTGRCRAGRRPRAGPGCSRRRTAGSPTR